MIRQCYLIIVLLALFIPRTVTAEYYEWYTVKEGVTGGINVRKMPDKNSEITKRIILEFASIVPLFKIVEKRGNGWFKFKSNRNGTPRNKAYKYKYYWVAGWLLRKVDLKKEKLALLVPADYEYEQGISIHSRPHVFSLQERDALPNKWRYLYAAVRMTGLHIGAFSEISVDYRNKGNFIVSEFIGIGHKNQYREYSSPEIYYTRSSYVDSDYHAGSLKTRKEPSILSDQAGDYGGGGIRVKVVGEQNWFYKTSKGKWIFKQCLVKEKK